MQFELALKEWGARKLEQYNRKVEIVRESVKVDLEFNEGYACCGGTDPDCYCSLAESPSASVEINGVNAKGKRYRYEMDNWDFDFATILGEIVEAGGGTIGA